IAACSRRSRTAECKIRGAHRALVVGEARRPGLSRVLRMGPLLILGAAAFGAAEFYGRFATKASATFGAEFRLRFTTRNVRPASDCPRSMRHLDHPVFGARRREALAAVAVLLTAACGSDHRLSKAAYEQHVQAAYGPVRAAFRDTANAPSLQDLAARVESVQTALHQAADEISALRP